MMPHRTGFIGFATAVAVACLSAAVAAQEAVPKNPDPRVQSYLEQHTVEISALRKTAEDRSANIEVRRQALRRLALISEDEVLPTAAKLVADPAPQIRRDAVDILSNSIVMAGHSGAISASDHHEQAAVSSVWSTYTKAQHDLVRDALRVASQNSPPETSLVALKALVRFSDQGAIDLVKQASASGAITATEAVRLCGQAPGNGARACLIDFLDKGPLEGRIAAVSVLGSIPSDRPMIRNKIFLNSEADPPLRAAAAEVLGSYDPAFASYALAITSDPKTPPTVYAATLRSYAVSAQAAGKLDAAQWSVIKRALDNKLQAAQESDRLSGSDTNSRPLKELLETFRQGRPPI